MDEQPVNWDIARLRAFRAQYGDDLVAKYPEIKPAVVLLDRGINPLPFIPAPQRAKAIAALERFERIQQRKAQRKQAAGIGGFLSRTMKAPTALSMPKPVKWNPTVGWNVPGAVRGSVGNQLAASRNVAPTTAQHSADWLRTWEGKTNLADQVGGWYHRIPGGINKAIDASQIAQHRHNANPALADFRQRYPSFSANQVRRPASVWAQEVKDTDNLEGFIVQEAAGQPIWVRAKPGAPDFVGDTTLQHELSHRAFGARGTGEDFLSSLVDAPDPKATLRRYLNSPDEIEVRLAEIKRRYANDAGRLVDSPEEADRALNWWIDEGVDLDNLRAPHQRASNPYAFAREIEEADEATKADMRLRMVELLGLGGIGAGLGTAGAAGTVKGAFVTKLAAEAAGLRRLPPPPNVPPIKRAPPLTMKKVHPTEVPTHVQGAMTRQGPGREGNTAPLQEAPKAQWWNPFQSSAEVARGNQLARQQQEIQRPTYQGQTNLATQIGRWYDNVPGGYEAAESAAMTAQARNDINRPTGDWRNVWPSFTRQQLHAPKNIYVQGQEGIASSNGLAYGGTDDIWLDDANLSAANSSSTPRVANPVLEHELSHASFGTQGVGPFPVSESVRNAAPAGYDEKFTNYVLKPTEIDVRLAEIKRRYANATGNLVTTPEQAEQAWDWWMQEGHKIDQARGFDRATLQRGGQDFYKTIPKEQLQQFFHRMPELVRNAPAGGSKMANLNYAFNKSAAAAAIDELFKAAQTRTGFSPIEPPAGPKPIKPIQSPKAPKPSFSPIAPPSTGAMKTMPAMPSPPKLSPQVAPTGGMFGWGQQTSTQATAIPTPGRTPIIGYESDGKGGLQRNSDWSAQGARYGEQYADAAEGTSYGADIPIWSTGSPRISDPNMQQYLDETSRYSNADALSTALEYGAKELPGGEYVAPAASGTGYYYGMNSDFLAPLDPRSMERFKGYREPGVTERFMQDYLPESWNDSMGVGNWAQTGGEVYDYAMDRSGARQALESTVGPTTTGVMDAIAHTYGDLLPNPLNPSKQYLRHGMAAGEVIDAIASDWPLRVGQKALQGANAAKQYATRVAPQASKAVADVAARAGRMIPTGAKTWGGRAASVARPVMNFFKPSSLAPVKFMARKAGPVAAAVGLGYDAFRTGMDVGANASVIPITNWQHPELYENSTWTPGAGNAQAVQAAGRGREAAYDFALRQSEKMNREAVRNYVPGAEYALGMDPETGQTNIEWMMGSVSPKTPGARQDALRQAYTDGTTWANGHPTGGYIGQADKQLQESIFHNVADVVNQAGGAAGYWASYPFGGQDYFDADSLADSPIIPTGLTPGMRKTPYQMWYGEGTYMHPDADISDATTALIQERMEQDAIADLAARAASQGQ